MAKQTMHTFMGAHGKVQEGARALRLPAVSLVSCALVLVLLCASTPCLPAGAGTQSKEVPGRTGPLNSWPAAWVQLV